MLNLHLSNGSNMVSNYANFVPVGGANTQVTAYLFQPRVAIATFAEQFMISVTAR